MRGQIFRAIHEGEYRVVLSIKYLCAFYLRVVLFFLPLLGGCSCSGCPCVSCWIWSSRVFGLLFIHMFSPLVRLRRWCESRSFCIVYFPLSCSQLMSLLLVAHVAVYCVPFSNSLYLLVTVALNMYICSFSFWIDKKWWWPLPAETCSFIVNRI